MSDTYFIKNLRCAYCGENNDFEEDAMKSGQVGLPHTSEFGGEFVCDKCKKKNEIVMNIVAVTSQPQGNLNKIIKKDFNTWNEVKKTVNAYELQWDFFYHQREVWWCSIGLNVDVETDGKQVNFERPVLVIQKFNKEMFWGVPLTSKERTGEFYEKITHDKGVAWVMLTQMRTFSSKRLLRKIGMIPEEDFAKIQKRICELLIRIEPLHGGGALGGRSH